MADQAKPFTDDELSQLQAWYENEKTYRSKYNTAPSAPIPDLLVGQMDDDIILRLIAQVRSLSMLFYRGHDAGVTAVLQAWSASLNAPIPKPVVLGPPELETLYRATEALRVLAGAAAKAGG